MADKTKRVDGEDLTAGCFLIVGDKEDTSTWKLPWKFSTDEKIKSHLRNALARFDQLTGVSEDDKKKAWSKLKKLCDEYGIDVGDDTSKGRAPHTKQRLRMEIKEITAEGSFDGILSPYNNVDDGGDLVEPGAYTKSIQERGSEIPLLWQHQTYTPIGKLTLEDASDGLHVKGQLLMELPEAKKAYLLIKARIVKGLSIGFESIKDAIESGVRKLKEVKLYEGSIVTFPMNERALITSVKAAGGEGPSDFNEELAEIQLCGASYDMMRALDNALSALRSPYYNAGLSQEELVAAAQTVIEQFSEAYMTFLPAYLALMEEWYGPMETMSKKRLEKKEGRRLSAATKSQIASAMEQHKAMGECYKSMGDILSALLQDEADGAADGDDAANTSKAKAARNTSEPGLSHSAAAESLIGDIRALIPA